MVCDIYHDYGQSMINVYIKLSTPNLSYIYYDIVSSTLVKSIKKKIRSYNIEYNTII